VIRRSPGAVLAAVAAVVAIAAVAWLTGTAAFQPSRAFLGANAFDHITVFGRAVAVGLVAATVVVLAALRSEARVGGSVAVLSITVLLASVRDVGNGPLVGLFVLVAWLAVPLAGMLTFRPTGAAWTSMERASAGLLSVGLIVGVVGDRGRGTATAWRATDGAPLGAALAVGLVLQLVALAIASIHVARRPDALVIRTRAARCIVLAWLAALAGERMVYLVGTKQYRDVFTGLFRPWSTVVAFNVPAVASLALLVLIAWVLIVRPRSSSAAGAIMLSERDPLEAARMDLASLTGDPSVRIATPLGDDRWADSSGDISSAHASPDRVGTVVTSRGVPIALIDHDVSLARSPDALASAAGLIAAAIDANRLLALSRVRLAERQRLGRRLVDADTSMRAEVLRLLETGPLGQLRECRDRITYGAPMDEIASMLQQVTSDVRRLSHGILPPELIDGSLHTALPDRRGAPSRRLPDAVQNTAYLLAVTDPAAWFEDRGSMLRVHCSAPVIEPAMADRIAAVGGTVNDAVVDLPVAVS
jgi:signal transduction histidine kinase